MDVFTQPGSFATEMDCPRHVRFPSDSDRTADIAGGPVRAPLTDSCAAANGISNRQYFDRPGASLLCKFRSPKATHQRPFCSHI
jgi:hypothetical protein